ncbi:SMC-Scp complex subunit ScpB [Cellulomonas sp. zg-ZUI222]|uniref:SMC-Scp complex subunit ScpB n=1 Tax=Cellulomonas wangleii TaxID=2816956 RepID=A0ABX8D028_9CELL|nr:MULTISPECIES: SMC-Scp complex subunit ScpB [Cellulomonas]MBO0900273.1 SMC-Scp complex subunit ScpB [Cellulomonas sp. zg-ZUI22]MBO0920813.1 SMC-Scp complex subunit ScpB [Cellulomonas wangleii]MBO0926591.1 SMC-Scp complex subunit ScpB [Cellulomonas wangleii]QVI60848.1 SMC-Scp complex subunit ScpB [Cellulomonas wangleii]
MSAQDAQDTAPQAPGTAPDAADAAPDELAFDVASLPGGALAALEAVLMVADEPVPAVRLATALALPTAHVEELLATLAAEYRGEGGGRPRGFELRRAGDGWRIYSAGPYADVVGRFVVDGQTQRLTQAALETLAVVAYRQPVSRGQVSAVRGVNVDGVMRTLSTRGLVAEVGQDAATGAVLYGTTGYFLERMGLSSLDELPPLAPYLPDIESLDGVDTTDGREDGR